MKYTCTTRCAYCRHLLSKPVRSVDEVKDLPDWGHCQLREQKEKEKRRRKKAKQFWAETGVTASYIELLENIFLPLSLARELGALSMCSQLTGVTQQILTLMAFSLCRLLSWSTRKAPLLSCPPVWLTRLLCHSPWMSFSWPAYYNN